MTHHKFGSFRLMEYLHQAFAFSGNAEYSVRSLRRDKQSAEACSLQSADENAQTDCVCSGAHCAAVSGFAALRMRRALTGGERHWQLQVGVHPRRPRNAPKFVICRPQRVSGNLAGPTESTWAVLSSAGNPCPPGRFLHPLFEPNGNMMWKSAGTYLPGALAGHHLYGR